MNISRKKTTSIYDIPYFKMGNNKVVKLTTGNQEEKFIKLLKIPLIG